MNFYTTTCSAEWTKKLSAPSKRFTSSSPASGVSASVVAPAWQRHTSCIRLTPSNSSLDAGLSEMGHREDLSLNPRVDSMAFTDTNVERARL